MDKFRFLTTLPYVVGGNWCTDDNWIMPFRKRSKVWEHFLENRQSSNLVKCIHCGIEYNFVKQQTSGLITHLLKIHKINLSYKQTKTVISQW